MTTGYGSNLDMARRAKDFAVTQLHKGADNRWSDFENSVSNLWNSCIKNQRNSNINTLDKTGLISSSANGIIRRTGIPHWIVSGYIKGSFAGCGNCGEFAAAAYVYLINDLKVRPVDYVERTDIAPKTHAFVVIGRVSGSDIRNFSTWGSACVICDPWDEKFYGAAEIPIKAHDYRPSFAVEIKHRAQEK